MLYFILWVVFLVGSILAFVITAIKNKPKRPKAVAPVPESMDEVSLDDSPAEEEGAVEEGFGDAPFQAEAQDADDFAAFENEFK